MSSQYKVCILTAGKGSRLNERTKYFNKALLRVGNKAVISYTIDSFPKEVEFVIGIGYLGDLVKQYLEITYPDRQFTFVETDKYSQPGAGPGFAIKKCREYLQCPFYYVSCDSMVDWENLVDIEHDWSGCATIKKTEAYKYCTLSTEEKGIIREAHDKCRNGTDQAYVGVSYIKNYLNFWENLDKESETCDGEIQVSPSILNIENMYAVPVRWFDTGNEKGLQKARDFFCGLENLDKLDEEIYIFDDFVVKYFYNKTTIKNRIERTKRLGNLVPEILQISDNFYKYKYIEGTELSLMGDSSEIVPLLLDTIKQNLWQKIELNDFGQERFNSACKKFYFDKTTKRLEKLNKEKIYIFGGKKEDTKNVINELEVPTIEEIFSKIDWDYLCNGIPVNFHGDFVFSNILHNSDGGFNLIDWRQDFGGIIDCGDVYYDLAKLNTEFQIPRKSLTEQKFYTDRDYLGITTAIEVPLEMKKCKNYFEHFVIQEHYDLTKIRTLTGIILLNMAPLHEYPLDEWLYYFGKYYLWKTIKRGKIDV